MHEITCPHCGKPFSIDESGYADIVKQVHDHEFERELGERLALAEQQHLAAVELAQTRSAAEHAKDAAAKDAELERLRSELRATEVATQLAVAEAVTAVASERDAVASALNAAKVEAELAQQRLAAGLKDEAAKKDAEIERLKAQLTSSDVEKRLAIKEAVDALERERDELRGEKERAELERRLREQSLAEQHGKEVALLNETIATYKDFKARLSTKMLGETLEQHCENSFESLRSTGFQRATFGKDNDASSGSKGDYIFREVDDAGTEFVSIMFEMKNEADTTATKKRNEDFLKELDKDRTEKGCEFAVLVSMLEPESDRYNAGIVDVSHLYPRMYVVRPQFFIPIITLLRNAALSTVQVRAELERTRQQNLDITGFEDRLRDLVGGWTSSVQLADKQFLKAIDDIDKAIRNLENVKEALRLTAKHLSTASGKADRITIKALTRGNPTMAAKFAELERADGGDPTIRSTGPDR